MFHFAYCLLLATIYLSWLSQSPLSACSILFSPSQLCCRNLWPHLPFHACLVDSFQMYISTPGVSSSTQDFIFALLKVKCTWVSGWSKQFATSRVKLNCSYKLSLLLFFSISTSLYLKFWCHLLLLVPSLLPALIFTLPSLMCTHIQGGLPHSFGLPLIFIFTAITQIQCYTYMALKVTHQAPWYFLKIIILTCYYTVMWSANKNRMEKTKKKLKMTNRFQIIVNSDLLAVVPWCTTFRRILKLNPELVQEFHDW